MTQSNVQHTLSAIEAFAASISSFAEATNRTWPFVTIDDFSPRAQRVARLSKANWVFYMPLVHEPAREDWNQYVQRERGAIYQQAIRTEQLEDGGVALTP